MTEGSVKRGDIFYADLSPVVGSEQGGTRPVLIVQNDTGNRHSPTVIAAAITSQTGKARLPTHINIAGGSVGLSKDSIILLEKNRWHWWMMPLRLASAYRAAAEPHEFFAPLTHRIAAGGRYHWNKVIRSILGLVRQEKFRCCAKGFTTGLSADANSAEMWCAGW